MDTTQVAVVGGGPGGYVAAFRAADLGLKVTLIDPEANPGGVCLHRGCIPSKAFLHAAALVNEAKHSADWGIRFAEPEIDVEKLNGWKDSVVGSLVGGLGQLLKRRKITHIRGMAKLTGNSTLEISLLGGGTQTLGFEYAILATGSRPTVIPSLAVDSPRFMDSTGALDMTEIPESLLVIGGGYIGLELGSVYASLGSKVKVVEMTPGLLPGADRDLVRPLQKRLETLFSAILLNTTVVGIEDVGDGLRVSFKDKDTEGSQQTFDKVLMSVGRRPNTAGLGLETTRIELDMRSFIVVDPQRRTAEPNIFAIGDIAGEPMLAHKASHEGIVAAEAIAGKKTAFEPNAIPAVVFTDPEIAWCGLTEEQAKKDGIPHAVARFPWGASGRATTLGRNECVTKIIADPETERVLGVGIAGPGAGEMIAEGTLAIEMGAVVSDLALTIHAHPTLSETVMEAAEAFHGMSAHIYAPKRS